MVRTFKALNNHTIKTRYGIMEVKAGDIFKGWICTGTAEGRINFEHFMGFIKEDHSIVNPWICERGHKAYFKMLSKKEARSSYRDNSKNKNRIHGTCNRSMFYTVREVMENMRKNHDRYVASLGGRCYYCEDASPASDCIFYDVDRGIWIERRLVSKMDETGRIEDLFMDVKVRETPVTHCKVCGRDLPENGGV